MVNDLTFHIIYTPGTVRYLRLFTLSLLKWLPCSFRLVPNGCSSQEISALSALSQRYSQVELILPPWNTLQAHSKVLNYLQHQESSDFFCFLDSDIFATGNFLSNVMEMLPNTDAIFSGLSFWQYPEECVWKNYMTEISGLHAFADDGSVLGTTFFAIYNNHTLTECIQSTGILLKAYKWHKIPQVHQARLTQIGRKVRFYDTAKLMNIMLRERGRVLKYQNFSSLHHIGGFSAVTTRKINAKRQLKSFKGSLNILRDWLFYRQSFDYFQRNLEQIQLYKRYFSSVLCYLFDNIPIEKTLLTADPQKREHLEWMTTQISILYNEFKDELGEQ